MRLTAAPWRSERGQARLAVAAVFGSMLAVAWGTLNLFGARYTDEDQTLFWVAAREIWHGHFREPCFYGQAYNTLWESVVAALPVGLGASPAWVLPIVALSSGLAPYFLFGAVAARRSRWWGLVVSAGPLLLPVHFWLLCCLASYNGGVLFATVGLFLLDRFETRLGRCAGLGLLALSLWINPNAMPLVLPGVLIAARRARWAAAWGLPGIAIAIGVVVASRAFYAAHPSYRLHVSQQDGVSIHLLVDGLRHIAQFWTSDSPESPFGPAGPLFVVVVAAASLWKRSRLDALALVSGILVAVVALATEKVHDGIDSIFLDRARMFIALPALAAFSAACAVRTGAWGDPKAFGWVALVAVATLGKLTTLPVEIDRWALPSGPVNPMRVRDLDDRCDEIARLAEGAGTRSVIFEPNDLRPLSYGCAARLDGRVTTLHPRYERRTWLLLDKVHSPAGRMLVIGPGPAFCHKVQGLCTTCAPVAPGRSEMLADCGQTPLLDVIKRGDLGLRPF